MKTLCTLLVGCLLSIAALAQSLKRIENLKDSWGLTYIYTGEVKDGKPNGMGVANYSSGNVLRYVGSFVNGTYNGKGTMLFDNGAFLSGEWKNGKLSGMGTNLTANGVLYIGNFVDGVKNGRGTMFYKENGAMIAGFKNDKLEGRGISLWNDGTIVSDVFYANDVRNGLGYQYEAKTKKLYAGEWRDDKWLQAASPSFTTFLKSAAFVGEMNENHVLMGATNSSKFLVDTAYYYDLVKKKRYFGNYVNGHLRNGLIIRDDSTRFLGGLDDNGAAGYCYDFKFKNYYSEGNYTNDLLNGKVLDISLSKNTVYYGDVVNGVFTGKAYFFNGKGTMYCGDYKDGKFTGNGYRMQANGQFLKGTWEDGNMTKLDMLQTEKGEVMNGIQKTFAEAVNNIVRTYPGLFEDITGSQDLNDEEIAIQDELDESISQDFNHSLINIPGSIGKNLIATDYDENTYFYARFLKTDNAAKAKAKYSELASQLQAVSLSGFYLAGKQKLAGKVTPPNPSDERTETVFTITGKDADYENFKVFLRMRKQDANYIVEIILGEMSEE
jgi:hypothetical protein